MPTVVGVRLRFSKTLWFDPAGTEPQVGDFVLVETERGREIGTVVQSPHEVEMSALPATLKPVVRLVDDEDIELARDLEAKERAALQVFRGLVEEHRLDMKPVAVEYLMDGEKIVFYFSAEERVDFRELVKQLAGEFHARIDMRQVGVRDEARSVGGIGHCGQVLCCVRFGGDFQPVSIRMAKEQDLPLNPLKISGLCGRLMCCLRYEYEAYKDFKSRAPKRGAMIDTPAGNAKVAELNTPRETVRIRLEDGTSVTVPLGEMECSKGSGCPCSVGKATFESLTNTSPAIEIAPVAEGVQPAAKKPEEPSRDGGRKRRRRKPAGDAGSAEKKQAPPKQQSQQTGKQAAKQVLKGQQPKQDGEAAGGSDKPSRSSRRRRRRRPSGGAAGGGEAGAT